MYAAYSPTRANEFPNDNPALHEGARWVCPRPLGAPRALLQAQPAEPSRVELAAEVPVPEPLAAAPEPRPAASTLAAPSAAPAAARPEARARLAVELAARCAGPLQLDLTRIVLPHRVADIPPPPDFIFRPLTSQRRAASSAPRALFEPSAAPPLTLLGYRVIDARSATSRVERRWRIDIAPCVSIDAPPRGLAPAELPLPAIAAARQLELPMVAARELPSPAIAAARELATMVAATELPLPAIAAARQLALPLAAALELPQSAVTAGTELPLPAVAGTELESLAQALFPALLLEAPMAAEPAILAPIAPPVAEPTLEPSGFDAPAIGLGAALLEPPPASEAQPSQRKQQRRRAARVASSATLAVAASAGNAELTRTLEEIETAFAERRSEQPRAARNRQSRRAAPKAAASKASAPKTTTPKPGVKKAGAKTAAPPDADEAPARRAVNAV